MPPISRKVQPYERACCAESRPPSVARTAAPLTSCESADGEGKEAEAEAEVVEVEVAEAEAKAKAEACGEM